MYIDEIAWFLLDFAVAENVFQCEINHNQFKLNIKLKNQLCKFKNSHKKTNDLKITDVVPLNIQKNYYYSHCSLFLVSKDLMFWYRYSDWNWLQKSEWDI